MPYTSRTGKIAPDFIPLSKTQVLHGSCRNCKLCKDCCDPCEACALNCRTNCCKGGDCCKDCKDCKCCTAECMVQCCEPCTLQCPCLPLQCPACCTAMCGPCCQFCKLNCNDCKPSCGTLDWRAVGFEITLGVGALEDLFGVWHVASAEYPACIPACAFPFCSCIPGLSGLCIGGKDELKQGDNFSIGGPTVTKQVSIFDYCCSCLPDSLFSPYARIKESPLGVFIDPPFDGQPPWWAAPFFASAGAAAPRAAKSGTSGFKMPGMTNRGAGATKSPQAARPSGPPASGSLGFANLGASGQPGPGQAKAAGKKSKKTGKPQAAGPSGAPGGPQQMGMMPPGMPGMPGGYPGMMPGYGPQPGYGFQPQFGYGMHFGTEFDENTAEYDSDSDSEGLTPLARSQSGSSGRSGPTSGCSCGSHAQAAASDAAMPGQLRM